MKKSGDQIENLFTEALALPTGRRPVFLDEVCAGNPALRAELESLLQADEEAVSEGFMQEPVFRFRAGAENTAIYTTYKLEGSLINHFKITEKLANGGMGVLYKAKDLQLNRFVALKFLSSHLSTLPVAKKRFIQEAKAASALDHPNICTIYEIGETENGLLYIAMPFYEGKTLKDLAKNRKLPYLETVDYLRQVAGGLQAAHDKGIIHRDIKPANILLTQQGLVKVLDFGIAKYADPDLTHTEKPVGTIAYMSPEQITGKSVDLRTDVWSLGVVFYELLTGRLPFHGKSIYRTMEDILHKTPMAVSTRNPGASAGLDEFIFKCLKKNPENRFESIQAFLDALDSLPKESSGRKGNAVKWRTSGVEDSFTGIAINRSAVHGRNKQLSMLYRCYLKAQQGQRQIIFISAEAGMGKTTLVNVFLQEIESKNEVFTGRGVCLEHRGEGEPYMPVLEALNSWCKTPLQSEFIEMLKTRAPTWLIQMPWLVDDAEFEAIQRKVAGTTKLRMLREFMELLERMTNPYPCILFIEDLHWSDYSTIQLLDGIARGYEPAKLMVIGTYRPSLLKNEDHPLYTVEQELNLGGRSVRIDLPLLNQRETEALIKDHLNSKALPASLPRLVHQKTDGNPLFIKHVVDDWKENKLLVEDETGRWNIRTVMYNFSPGIPETLRKLIEQQITRLEPDDRKLLEIASIAGMEFPIRSVAISLDEDTISIEKRCIELSRRGLFIHRLETGEDSGNGSNSLFRFRHCLYQEVLYNRIPGEARAGLHASLGTYLEKFYKNNLREHASELAMHFTRGHEPRKAVKYLEMAAQRAFQRSAHHEAIEHLMKAVGLLQMLPKSPKNLKIEVNIRMMLGTAYIAVNGWASKEAEKSYLQAHNLAKKMKNSQNLILLLFRMATMYELRGKYARSRKLLDECLSLSASMKKNSILLDSHDLMACTTFHQGEFDIALEHAKKALKLYKPQNHFSLLAVYGVDPSVSSHDWAALSLWFLGFPDKAEKEAMQAIRSADYHQYSLASAQVRAAWLYQCRRDEKQVERWAGEAVQLAAEKGFAYHQAFGNILLGWSFCMQDQQDMGMDLLKNGISDCERMGAKMDEPFYKALLAEIYGNSGWLEEGIKVLNGALRMFSRNRSYFYESDMYRLKGDLLIRSGEPEKHEKARSCYQKGLQIARLKKSLSLELRSAIGLSRLLAVEGEFKDAHRILEGIYNRFCEGYHTPDLIEAKKLLDTIG